MSVAKPIVNGSFSSLPSLAFGKIMRRTGLLAAIAAIGFWCGAACAPPTSRAEGNLATSQAPDLGAIIDGLQNNYSRMRGIAADFIQMYRGNDGRTIRETGHLLLKRPSKARWEYSEPEPKLFVSDGKNVFFYVLGEKHATKSAIKESVDPQIPFLFLLGRGNLRRDFSRIEVVVSERPVEAGNVVLKLVPKRAPEEFKLLLVELSPASYEVRRLVIIERSGARMDFLLSNVRKDYVAPDDRFQFIPPPGVIVKKAQ
ncbi:MAG TPA: outer membrane lipoprotein carrier protein LolA [Blastocatellia bacterium]|nr:outer membrane lipoprotein carrier protein LolA [Blastocatellia bacterium]